MVFGATNSFNPNSGYDLISRLLVIVVLGGLGSIGGALIAAVVALVIEDVTAVLWSPVWASTMFFAVLVVVLLVRPNGLFGQRRCEHSDRPRSRRSLPWRYVPAPRRPLPIRSPAAALQRRRGGSCWSCVVAGRDRVPVRLHQPGDDHRSPSSR